MAGQATRWQWGQATETPDTPDTPAPHSRTCPAAPATPPTQASPHLHHPRRLLRLCVRVAQPIEQPATQAAGAALCRDPAGPRLGCERVGGLGAARMNSYPSVGANRGVCGRGAREGQAGAGHALVEVADAEILGPTRRDAVLELLLQELREVSSRRSPLACGAGDRSTRRVAGRVVSRANSGSVHAGVGVRVGARMGCLCPALCAGLSS